MLTATVVVIVDVDAVVATAACVAVVRRYAIQQKMLQWLYNYDRLSKMATKTEPVLLVFVVRFDRPLR